MTITETPTPTLNGRYTIDASHTRIGFIARHVMITKVRGSFNEFSGEGVLDLENPAASKISLSIEAASIDTRNSMRDEHLRSNDFLSAPDFPQITFVSTAVTPLMAKDQLTGLSVTGDLTIKGTAKEISFDLEFTGAAVDPYGNHRVGFEGTTSINRSDWGVSYNGALEAGGVLISEAITLEFEVEGILQA